MSEALKPLGGEQVLVGANPQELGIMLAAATRVAERFGAGQAQSASAIREIFAAPTLEHIPAGCAWFLHAGHEGTDGEPSMDFIQWVGEKADKK